MIFLCFLNFLYLIYIHFDRGQEKFFTNLGVKRQIEGILMSGYMYFLSGCGILGGITEGAEDIHNALKWKKNDRLSVMKSSVRENPFVGGLGAYSRNCKGNVPPVYESRPQVYLSTAYPAL